MLLPIAFALVTVIELYALAGVVFALLFLPRAIVKMDHGLQEAPRSVRWLILPGMVALWPLFARRWASGASAPAERNPHRDKAGRR
jgi:hypothetical protein